MFVNRFICCSVSFAEIKLFIQFFYVLFCTSSPCHDWLWFSCVLKHFVVLLYPSLISGVFLMYFINFPNTLFPLSAQMISLARQTFCLSITIPNFQVFRCVCERERAFSSLFELSVVATMTRRSGEGSRA